MEDPTTPNSSIIFGNLLITKDNLNVFFYVIYNNIVHTFKHQGNEMRGGKRWFAIESKTFEVSVEKARGKIRGTIMERSRGLSS